MVENLKQLRETLHKEYEWAKENARLASEVDCFNEQADYWNGKVEAYENVLKALTKADEVVKVFTVKKSNFLYRIKSKLGVPS